MGTEFAGAVCGLTLLGYWVDRRYGSGIKATLICAAIGVVGGLYNFIRQALVMQKEAERERRWRAEHPGERSGDE